MSWRSIEMQVALPRTQDAGKMQEQQMKQNQHFQESLAGVQLKQQLEKRKQVTRSETTEKIKKEDKRTNCSEQNEKEQEQQSINKNDHPFLGKRIDFNG
ncbi:hypothetical protein [Oceanobacillus jordanicus]|uniref:RNA polymerase subunit sigma n=1 Tax=Oceanobacillus jordanicus TaxID=2867266 RepID=A0AAW5B6A5_9BACI|nr:hypothetical protein [Oceanobacillus jordanicus]MCG3419069.1 hypothetical protein [Oceanobacillus jordanicus]